MSVRQLGISLCAAVIAFSAGRTATVQAQPASEAETRRIQAELTELQRAVADLRKSDADERLLADVDVYAKAAEWILRHQEFFKPNYVQQTIKALETGRQRARDLAAGRSPWTKKTGTTIRGYYSKVDGSVQPYALSVPEGVDPSSGKRWPLHLKLHGRAGQMNEVNFISRFDGKPLPKNQNWIQLDVFGRTNNAYRWAGETDVFEALENVRRRYRIDNRRITLWGFSMGGAGAWHLGLHHPSKWSSVGPGAGFIDFYNYQKVTKQLPAHQHKTLRIYDSIDYALNAVDVPVCTYGGELDAQLVASTAMVDAAKKVDAPIKLLIGPGMGHKFHPESFKEFMAFHLEKSKQGRKPFPGMREIRFVTHTLKYNTCEWLTIEEMLVMYEPAVVQATVDKNGTLKVTTKNVAVLQVARDVADLIEIDGKLLRLNSAADGLLPGVFYEKGSKEWHTLDYDASRAFQNYNSAAGDGEYSGLRKRHNLQGPIDDAFMQPFVCVRGTGKAWSQQQTDWADWTLKRFEREFDKWLRGKVPVVTDKQVTDELIAGKNLILFGDPGSNSVLAKIVEKLPVTWTKDGIEIDGRKYDPDTHGLSLIYPNPLNPKRYVVINSGHTFHQKDFKASNSWLFPRLGDIAVQKFAKSADGGYTESIVWADLFNPSWRLMSRKSE